ncbi:MAG: histidine triad (HIT) family protein [Cryomorphaceae bacterium]|jgi:histidine triad (HIT) family protein
MASVFTKIIGGEIPSYKVHENEKFFAFLDISPLKAGHTLVVPKEEIDYIFDMPNDLLSEILVFSKEVARKIEAVIECERIGVSVIGLEVPHAHVHLIPMNSVSDMNFAKPKLELDSDYMMDLAEKIRQA